MPESFHNNVLFSHAHSRMLLKRFSFSFLKLSAAYCKIHCKNKPSLITHRYAFIHYPISLSVTHPPQLKHSLTARF